MSLRYLEYVERYPARPGAAAALQTTPAALLGAGAQAPPGYERGCPRGAAPLVRSAGDYSCSPTSAARSASRQV
jgi:hypothetical protein